jgi:hypothetical protein
MRLGQIFGNDLADEVLRNLFLKSLISFIMNNEIQVTKRFNLDNFKEQFSEALEQILGTALTQQFFEQLFRESMVNLVIQPPKQKISNAYLREYERMKVAEEFA